MKATRIRIVIFLTSACGVIPADAQQTARATDATNSVRQRMELSVSRQTAAAHSMQVSIERQKGSVQRQTGGRTEGFFDTPGLTGLPGGSPASLPPACDPLPAPEIESLVQTASRREGVDADLIRGVMKEESAFRPCAVSPKGAMGLMQLMPMTAGDLGVSNPFDPEENVNAGTQFLKRLMVRYGGDLALTLGAYNAGPARVDRTALATGPAVPQIPETVDYVRDVLSLFLGQKRLIAPALLETGTEPQPDEESY